MTLTPVLLRPSLTLQRAHLHQLPLDLWNKQKRRLTWKSTGPWAWLLVSAWPKTQGEVMMLHLNNNKR
jgi:hypothetical protein